MSQVQTVRRRPIAELPALSTPSRVAISASAGTMSSSRSGIRGSVARIARRIRARRSAARWVRSRRGAKNAASWRKIGEREKLAARAELALLTRVCRLRQLAVERSGDDRGRAVHVREEAPDDLSSMGRGCPRRAAPEGLALSAGMTRVTGYRRRVRAGPADGFALDDGPAARAQERRVEAEGRRLVDYHLLLILVERVDRV